VQGSGPDHPLRIVIVGSGGRLGAALLRTYRRGHQVVGFNRAQLDLAAPARLREELHTTEFDLLINCAAQTNVDRCEQEPAEAFSLNAEAPGVLAEICAAKGARLIHLSTDYVFDGEKTEPYTEEDEPAPISVYGESKWEGERRVLAADENHLVVRVSWIFGPDRPSFIDWIIEQARQHAHVEAIADKISTPTYTLDIAELLRPLLWDRSTRSGGVFHLTNRGQCSWQEYGQWALDCCHAEGARLRARVVNPIRLSEMKNFIARRPLNTVLATGRYERLTSERPRSWRDAVAAYVRDHVAASR